MEKMFVHDGLIFHYTTQAIDSGNDDIGFYFDHLGLPQRICRKSLYGKHILAKAAQETTEDHSMKNTIDEAMCFIHDQDAKRGKSWSDTTDALADAMVAYAALKRKKGL